MRLLPAGAFRATDGSGRPNDAPAWRIDRDLAAGLVARANARASRPVVDYEHQTLLTGQNGQAAPAAGWIEALAWREPDPAATPAEPGGLYATIAWTERAAAMIAAGEYRYISPVFPYAADGAVLDILHAGLTNNPGLDGLTDLAVLSALTDQETPMKELLKALGLADTATEAEALTALAALKSRADQADGKVAALTAQLAQDPDPAKWVPMATHAQTQNALADLTAKVETGERDGLMTAALADGRILPAQEAYWRAQPIAALKAYLEVAQPVAALAGSQTGGKKPGGAAQGDALTDTQQAVCKQLGVKPEDFMATLKAAA